MPASKTLLSWSTGKDAAWALHCLRQDAMIEVVGLVSTINAAAARVAMHGVRRELLDAQAAAAGLPLFVLPLPSPCPNQVYEDIMATFVASQVAAGVEAIAFGDLFLADVRRYRENALAGSGMRAIFPLWGLPTAPLARAMIAAGLEAYISCVDPARLPARFAGRAFDLDLLAELPAGVDPCGENGEFHSFAWAGPMFDRRLAVAPGERVLRDGFIYCDLLAQWPRAPAPEAT
ncbi:MAG TPA: ATP-binding protein [Hyphomicrobiaceae bacterium]|jgi:uncharacterized protein (TIGR00290 family)|nr:ATP-binding protein [Hyphomicrobiaceae bacterium]